LRGQRPLTYPPIYTHTHTTTHTHHHHHHHTYSTPHTSDTVRQGLLPIPRVATLDSPDMRHCLAHQKLEMINCCIRKQQARNELVRRRKAGGGGGGGAGSGGSGSGAREGDDSDSDEEFHSADEDDEDELVYLAPDAEKTLLAAGTGGATTNAGSPPTATASGSTNDTQGGVSATTKPPPTAAAEPEGVAEVSADLVLLGSGESLRVPVTQSEGPMTEDMMERKLEAMTEMGTSDEAIAARTQMQSTSLRSDMSAFKAANPGARIHVI
jgi:Rab3 GTPase-activating protein catalytic subunit